MSLLTLAQLVVRETRAAIYERGLAIATSLGLPVTSWQVGDPTRSEYHFIAEALETLETMASGFVASGFLEFASADSTLYEWLVLLAHEVYGYDAAEATFATTEVLLVNAGAAVYPIEIGAWTGSSSLTGKTYHNTSAGTVAGRVACTFTDAGDTINKASHGLANGTRVRFTLINSTTGIALATTYYVVNAAAHTFQVSLTSGGAVLPLTTNGSGYYCVPLVLDVAADEAGSDSSAAAHEIDTMVTTLLGVTCDNDVAAIGIDAESALSIVTGCRDKLGSLSPNGPKDAYNYVARRSELTGTTGITRTRTLADSTTGDVTVYLAGPSGAVSGADRTLAETAITQYATPLCVTPTIYSAVSHPINVTYTAWLYASVGQTEAEIKAAIADALADAFLARPIGGDVIAPATTGAFYVSLIESTIREAFPAHTFRMSVSAPATDEALAMSEVASLGTITATIYLEVDP